MEFDFDFSVPEKPEEKTSAPAGKSPADEVKSNRSVTPEIVGRDEMSVLRQNLSLPKMTESVERFKIELKKMESQVQSLKVVDDESNQLGTEMLIQLATISKNVDASFNKNPVWNMVVRLKLNVDKFKRETFAQPVTNLTNLLKPKIIKYQKEQQELARRIAQKKADEEAERQRKEQEKERASDIERQKKEKQDAIDLKAKLDKEAEAAGVEKVEVTIPEIVEPPPVDIIVAPELPAGPAKVTIDGGGSSSIKMKWVYDIIDVSKVPREYMIPDEKKIAGAVKKLGVRAIPGIRIFETPDISTRIPSKSSVIKQDEFEDRYF